MPVAGRAMVLHAPAPIDTAPLRAELRPRPAPGPADVLVRVTACGVCRTDLHVVEGELPPVRPSVVPGHQIVGRVIETGARAGRFAPGDRVGVAWLRHTCGVCPYCTTGRENLCEAASFTGYHADGGYADYCVAPAAFAYAVPDGFSDVAAAPLLCAGIIGYRALTLAGVRPGERLGMYGFGSSAHITLQIARARGTEVYVWTREPGHRDLARRLGAAWAGDLGDAPPAPTEGAIIFAPVGSLVPVALRHLAPGGTLALAGIYMSDIPSFPYADLFRERIVRSVTANTRADAVAFLAEAVTVPVRAEVTTFPLEDANRALLALKRGEVRGSGVLVVENAPGV
jgi:propanol-preferring alcohol dehydrogenase